MKLTWGRAHPEGLGLLMCWRRAGMRAMTRKQKLVGRLRVVKQLASVELDLALDIGCKNVRLGSVNVDLDPKVRPDIVADVLYLPFRNEIFSLVYFTDVIEHLPVGKEERALSEIFEVLRKNGTLILTTPNDMRIYSILDPARYVVRHRHYKVEIIKNLIEKSGFIIEKIFTAGGLWELIAILWYYFITFPLVKIFKRELPFAPPCILSRVDSEYSKARENEGYTIFVQARKRK